MALTKFVSTQIGSWVVCWTQVFWKIIRCTRTRKVRVKDSTNQAVNINKAKVLFHFSLNGTGVWHEKTSYYKSVGRNAVNLLSDPNRFKQTSFQADSHLNIIIVYIPLIQPICFSIKLRNIVSGPPCLNLCFPFTNTPLVLALFQTRESNLSLRLMCRKWCQKVWA